MSTSVPAKRAYRSPKREQQAARTRERIVEAAADLFSTRGYGATTMAEIAREAAVSVESVHATGSKPTLLLEAFRHSLSGQATWGPMLEVESIKRIFEGVDADDAVDRIVHFLAVGHARSGRLMLEFRNVAATDPSVAREWDAHAAYRRDGYRVGTAWMIQMGIIEAEVPLDQMELLTAAVSNLTSSETYIQLTDDWGFDDAQYRAWLGRQLRRMRP